MKYSWNWTKQKPKSLIYQKTPGARRRLEGGLPGGQTPPRRGPTLARAWVASGPTRAPPTPPLRPYIPCFGKTPGTREKIHEKFRSRRHRRSKIQGTEVSVPAPCRDGEVPPEPSPSTPPPSSSPSLSLLLMRE